MNTAEAKPYPYNSEFRSTPAENFSVLNGFELIHDVVLEAKRAQNRVVVQNMANYTGHPENLLFHALKGSALRGIPTSLTTDWFSKMVAHDGLPRYANGLPIGDGKLLRDLTQQSDQDLYERLAASGVDIRFTNPPKGKYEQLNPFSGRSHIKFIVIDDIAYLGGVNMHDSSFKGVDFMVKIKDKQLADILIDRVSKHEPQDYCVVLNNGDTLLVDSGKKGESIILDAAVGLIDNSEESVRNHSFFTPDGKLVESLIDAEKREVDVQVAIPEEISGLKYVADFVNRLAMKIKGQHLRIRKFKGDAHVKMLIIDDRLAMFGSHNLMGSGVKMGTAEIAYLTSNPIVVANLRRFSEDLINQAA